LLRQLVIAIALATLVAGFTETVIFAVVDQGLHHPPAFVGFLEFALGAGAVAGGLASARLVRRLGPVRAASAGMALLALGTALLAVPALPVVFLGMAAVGSGVPPLVVALFTTLQLHTPLPLQGRVYAAVDVLVSTPQTVSIAVGAGLAAVLDYHLMLGIMCGVLLISMSYLATRRPTPAAGLPDAAHSPAPHPDGAQLSGQLT
jgi:MFS family permease